MRIRLKALAASMVTLAMIMQLGACVDTRESVLGLPLADGATEVTPVEASVLIEANRNNPTFFILDVRTPDEYNAGHIPGAVNKCLNCTASFAEALGSLDPMAEYLVYCRSGSRSADASLIMAQEGFTRIYNLTDGIRQWQAEGFPVVTDE